MVAIYLLFLLPFINAEHSGAYSSPQYAKKMYPKNYDATPFLPKENPAQFNEETIDRFDSSMNDTTSYARSSLLDTAGSFLSGTGAQVVSSLAKDFIARSTGTSQVGFDCMAQVLSLNLTNLVILIVLKALILAAGFFGAGAFKGHHYGRSLDALNSSRHFECFAGMVFMGRRDVVSVSRAVKNAYKVKYNSDYTQVGSVEIFLKYNDIELKHSFLLDNKNASYITEEEILLYLSYLSGQQNNDYGCLYRLSCQKPHQAALYSSSAELMLQGTKLFRGNINLEPYEDISNGIREATSWGERGLPCQKRYQCK